MVGPSGTPPTHTAPVRRSVTYSTRARARAAGGDRWWRSPALGDHQHGALAVIGGEVDVRARRPEAVVGVVGPHRGLARRHHDRRDGGVGPPSAARWRAAAAAAPGTAGWATTGSGSQPSVSVDDSHSPNARSCGARRTPPSASPADRGTGGRWADVRPERGPSGRASSGRSTWRPACHRAVTSRVAARRRGRSLGASMAGV